MSEDAYPDPYPGVPNVEIEDFRYREPLIVRRDAVAPRPGVHWLVHKDYRVQFRLNGQPTALVVPEGTATDFASVPRFFRFLISKIGPHAEASVIHDYLYVAWKIYRPDAPRPEDRLFADELFLAAMIAANVTRWRRNLAYLAVRWFGWLVF